MNRRLPCAGALILGAALISLPAQAQIAAAGILLPADMMSDAPSAAREPRIDAWLAQGCYAQALAKLEQDLATQPRNAQARFQRAVALAGLGRTDEAIAAFSHMTQDFPELPEPYINLAALHAERGEFLRARELLRMASRVAPENALAQARLEAVYPSLAAPSRRNAPRPNPKNAAAQTAR